MYERFNYDLNQSKGRSQSTQESSQPKGILGYVKHFTNQIGKFLFEQDKDKEVNQEYVSNIKEYDQLYDAPSNLYNASFSNEKESINKKNNLNFFNVTTKKNADQKSVDSTISNREESLSIQKDFSQVKPKKRINSVVKIINYISSVKTSDGNFIDCRKSAFSCNNDLIILPFGSSNVFKKQLDNDKSIIRPEPILFTEESTKKRKRQRENSLSNNTEKYNLKVPKTENKISSINDDITIRSRGSRYESIYRSSRFDLDKRDEDMMKNMSEEKSRKSSIRSLMAVDDGYIKNKIDYEKRKRTIEQYRREMKLESFEQYRKKYLGIDDNSKELKDYDQSNNGDKFKFPENQNKNFSESSKNEKLFKEEPNSSSLSGFEKEGKFNFGNKIDSSSQNNSQKNFENTNKNIFTPQPVNNSVEASKSNIFEDKSSKTQQSNIFGFSGNSSQNKDENKVSLFSKKDEETSIFGKKENTSFFSKQDEQKNISNFGKNEEQTFTKKDENNFIFGKKDEIKNTFFDKKDDAPTNNLFGKSNENKDNFNLFGKKVETQISKEKELNQEQPKSSSSLFSGNFNDSKQGTLFSQNVSVTNSLISFGKKDNIQNIQKIEVNQSVPILFGKMEETTNKTQEKDVISIKKDENVSLFSQKLDNNEKKESLFSSKSDSNQNKSTPSLFSQTESKITKSNFDDKAIPQGASLFSANSKVPVQNIENQKEVQSTTSIKNSLFSNDSQSTTKSLFGNNKTTEPVENKTNSLFGQTKTTLSSTNEEKKKETVDEQKDKPLFGASSSNQSIFGQNQTASIFSNITKDRDTQDSAKNPTKNDESDKKIGGQLFTKLQNNFSQNQPVTSEPPQTKFSEPIKTTISNNLPQKSDLMNSSNPFTSSVNKAAPSIFSTGTVNPSPNLSVFGQNPPTIGNPVVEKKSLFGATDSTQNQGQSLFGNTKTNDHEETMCVSPAMNPNPDPTPSFSNSTKNIFSNSQPTGSLFGSSAQNTSNLFGNQNAGNSIPSSTPSQSLFGLSTNQNSGNLFGTQTQSAQNTGSLFGNTAQNTPNSGSLFGNAGQNTNPSQGQPSSLFGSQPANNLFANNTSSIFSQNPSNLFGASKNGFSKGK